MVLERALELVGAPCDLEQRARDIPPSARVRGVWMRSAEQELLATGKLTEYEALTGARTSAMEWYPLTEGLARMALAAALLESPAEVHRGLHRIGRTYPLRFSESLLGRTLIRLRAPDPARVLQQAAAARRQTCDYGRWELHVEGPRRAVMWHREEYGWIDSLVLGSAEATFEAIGVPARIEVKLVSAYEGAFEIEW